MAGRGRGATLPAWMTATDSGTPPTLTGIISNDSRIESTNTVQSVPIISSQPIPQVSKPLPLQNVVTPAFSMTFPSAGSYQNPLLSAPQAFQQVNYSIGLQNKAPIYPGYFPRPVMGMMQPNMMQSNMMSMPQPMKPQQPQPTSYGDPNNEQKNWNMYTATDGRKYWYNKITELSTYDKPFCLKTPEERSIPPCKWKEYLSDGKKYYSDGIESV